MVWIALAGPMANLVVAFLLGGILTYFGSDLGETLSKMVRYGHVINLALAFFNLLPIPPLDGSRVLKGVLPIAQAQRFGQLEMYGPVMLIGLIVVDQILRLGIIRIWIGLPMQISLELMNKLFSSL